MGFFRLRAQSLLLTDNTGTAATHGSIRIRLASNVIERPTPVAERWTVLSYPAF